MKGTKTPKGITLIALIITIIVLLILAVVAIGAVRDGGIITHAQNAARDYTIAQEKEKIALAYSEYFMRKRTDPNATLKVEGATVSGSEESGWEVTFDKTSNTYQVDKDGNIEVAKELVISEEKDIGAITYMYRTIYNPNQPEVIPARGYYNDENNDKIDDDSSMIAMIDGPYFNIKNTFFEQDMPTEGNINAKITHLDGRVEDIILTTTDNKAWTAEIEFPFIGENIKADIGFRPNAQYRDIYGEIDKYEESAEYHYMYVPGGVWIPFQKIEILGKTIEFPYERLDALGYYWKEYEIYPMFNNAENVTKVILNFSDNTKKIYNSDTIVCEGDNPEGIFAGKAIGCNATGTGTLCRYNKYYGLNFPTVTSVILEEDGKFIKYNVSSDTKIQHSEEGT